MTYCTCIPTVHDAKAHALCLQSRNRLLIHDTMLYQEAFGDDFDLLGKVLFSLDSATPLNVPVPDPAY